MRLNVGLLLTCCWMLACAGGPSATSETENFGYKGDLVWVRGPWSLIEPSKDVDEIIDQLCPAIMRLPNADKGEYGEEYCGALYLLEGVYYASYPSPLGAMARVGGRGERKQCKPPRYVEDLRGQPTIIADFHNHPWATSMSRQDRRGPNQLWSIRVQFDTKCHVMKLIPYLEENRPGELYERQGKSWKLIGIIKPEDKEAGIITEVAQKPPTL